MIAGIHFQNCWFLTAEKCWFYSTAYKWKSDMVEKLYGIPKSHCYYTLDTDKKPMIAKKIVDEHFPGLSPRKVVCVDDSDETLGRYMKETDFCTAHPMIFMEHLNSGLQ